MHSGGTGGGHIVFGLVVTFAVWLGLATAVVVGRWRYDRRTRTLFELTQHEHDVPTASSLREVDRVLSRMSRRAVYRLIANPTLPPWLTERCVAYTLDRWGLECIRRDALPPSEGGRQKWRRVSALFALGQLRVSGVHDLLARALTDRDTDVAGATVLVLHRLHDRRAAEILVDALVQRSYAPSRIATQLDQFSMPIGDVLRPLLSSPQAHARFWGTSLLHRYPDTDDLSRQIASLATDLHAPVRKAVLETLSEMNPAAAIVVASHLVNDPTGYVRARAVRAFALRPSQGLTDVASMARAHRIAPMLADVDWNVRLAAKEALVDLGPSVWREVSPYLESPDRFARNGAAEVLQNLGLVDRLLGDAARGVPDEGHALLVLEGAFREGGQGMIDAAVARSTDTPAPAVANLLLRLGFVESRTSLQ